MKRFIVALLGVVVFGLVGVVQAGHDQSLEIVLAEDGCVHEIVPTGVDNCQQGSGDRGACQGKKDCACANKGKWVNWTTSSAVEFSIEFPQGSPFKRGCAIDNPSPNGKGCKVRNTVQAGEEFKYDVLVENCPRYDPRIIIRQ